MAGFRRTWAYNPRTGGAKTPKAVQQRTRQRILSYAEAHYSGKYTRIEVRFHGWFCYIDAYTEPAVSPGFPPPGVSESEGERLEALRNTPVHLCRLRYLGNENRWSMAIYTYSHEKYEPCVFLTGAWHGTPEEAFEISAMYLQD